MLAKKFVVIFALMLSFMAALAIPMAHAEDYPARVIKIVVPFPAGGTADVMPRVIAERLSRKWGQTVIVENHTGAGGNIGAEVVAKSKPDGYTLLASPPPPLVINQNLYPHLEFDPQQFVPIVVMARVPNALVVNPDKIAANNIKDFIAYAQANPGKITDATQGNGTTSHLTSEMFQMMTHVKLQNVPYRGSAPALNDLVAGSVDCMFDNLGVSLQLVKAGRLKLIAVASPQRMTSLPDVPAIAETFRASSPLHGMRWWRRRALLPRSLRRSTSASIKLCTIPRCASASPIFQRNRSVARRRKPQITSNKKPSAGRTSSPPRM